MDLPLKVAIGFVGVAVLLLLYWVCKATLQKKQQSTKSHAFWHLDLKKIFLSPIRLLLITLGIYYSVVFFGIHFPQLTQSQWLVSVRDFFILASCFWVVFRWKKEIFRKKLAKLSMVEMVNKVITIALFVLFILMSLAVFDVDIVPLLAFGGIGAAAVGFAAKDVLSNLFGGAMLSISRPFIRGDFVILPEKNLEGHVEEIGWYLTCIRDRSKYPMYFPNSIFSSATVINQTRMSHRRVFTDIQIAYNDSGRMSEITTAIREYFLSHPKVDKDMNLMVYWKEAGDYGLLVVIDVYVEACKISDFVVLRQSILQDVFKVIEGLGVEIPYPTSVVKLEK